MCFDFTRTQIHDHFNAFLEYFCGNWIESLLLTTCWRTICLDLWVRHEKLSLLPEIDVWSPQARDLCVILESGQVYSKTVWWLQLSSVVKVIINFTHNMSLLSILNIILLHKLFTLNLFSVTSHPISSNVRAVFGCSLYYSPGCIPVDVYFPLDFSCYLHPI